jgi:hypothetical protein
MRIACWPLARSVPRPLPAREWEDGREGSEMGISIGRLGEVGCSSGWWRGSLEWHG